MRSGIIELKLKAPTGPGMQPPAMICGSPCDGAYFEVLKPVHGGVSSAVRLPKWQPGGMVTVHFASQMVISKTYHATPSITSPTAITFALENKPNSNGIFQFTATGKETTASVTCGAITPPPPPLIHPPPPPLPPRPPPPPDRMSPARPESSSPRTRKRCARSWPQGPAQPLRHASRMGANSCPCRKEQVAGRPMKF